MKKVLVLIIVLMMVIPSQAFTVTLMELPKNASDDFNGIFEIEVKTENGWFNAGSIGFGKFQETKEFDLGEYLNGKNALIKITQNGGGAAYLDAVFLEGEKPIKANYSEGKVLNKLCKEDLDVTPVSDGIVLEFTANKVGGKLSITGRIENEVISKEPLQFPLANNYKIKNQITDFYSYKFNSNYGKITADGELDEDNNLEVFAQEYQVPGSGHPAGDTYFWVMNDDENLYVTMDFTPDNTYDGDKDYAKVYVNTSEGIKEFKVSVPENKWGNAGFTYTDKVVYEHKVYEFLIPLNEIGNITDELELAFVGYGTAALPPEAGLPRLAYDPVNKIYLSVFQKDHWEGNNKFPQVYGQFVFLNENGTETVCTEFMISDKAKACGFPDVAYDSENNVFLVIWEQYDLNSTLNFNSISGKVIDVTNIDDYIIGPTIDITSYSQEEYTNNVSSPAIAYDEQQKQFLVVWEDRSVVYVNDNLENSFCIKGKFIKFTPDNVPTINNEPLIISIPSYAVDNYPAVCYSNSHDSFIVVWVSFDEAIMIQGNIIKSTVLNPTPVDFSDLIIIESGKETYAPSVSINNDSKKFLVTWGYENNIYGSNVDLSLKASEPERITPDNPDSYAYHSTSFYDGEGSMLCLWNNYEIDTNYGYIKMKTIGESEIYETYNPEKTDTNSGGYKYFNLIDSCGDGKGEILVAYGRYNVNNDNVLYNDEDINPIGYRFISDVKPDYSDESEPDLAYHSGLDIYLSVFVSDNYASQVRESFVYGQLVDNEGDPIGERFLINDGKDNEDPEDDGCLDLPSVAVDKNGDFLVAWAQSFSESKIYAAKVVIDEISKNTYDVQVGEAFRVSNNSDNEDGQGIWCYYNEYSPDIAYNSMEDNFLIVWTQYINDSPDINKSQMDIYGSVVSIEGNIKNSTFPVSRKANDNDQLDQGEASVCYSASDNRYIAAWTEVNIGTFSIIAIVIGDDGEVYFDDRVVIAENALNSNVSYNKDKFLISWSNDTSYEVCGAYYNISGNTAEIIDEEFVISAVPTDAMYMSDVFPAAYFDGHNKMLCVWNPGFEFGLYKISADFGDLYAKLNYINYDGTVGTPFYTDEPESVKGYEPIAITGNMMGQFLIAYVTLKENTNFESELYRIGYRLIGEFIPEPKEPKLEFVDTPYEVLLGNTIQAKVNYFDGIEYIDVTGDVFEYKSESTEIATITSSGAITGVAAGEVKISADYVALINDVPTTLSAITTVNVYKKSTPRPIPQKTIIGQIIVDDKVIKNIYEEDLVADGGFYSFSTTKTGDNAKLWLLGSYYKQIANKTPRGTLQLIWDAASYNLPLKSEEVLKDVNTISDSKLSIIIDKVDDKEIFESATDAVDKLSGKMVSGLVDFDVTIEGNNKKVNIDSYDLYVTRTIDKLNQLDAYTTTAMKLIEDDEVFTFAPSIFDGDTATIKYRGNGIFAIVNNPKTFSDITNHWSKINVEKLATRNIAFGKDDSLFAPNDYVTRAEFAVMITRALGITEEEGTMNFDDVKGWFAEDISTAYDAGLINGKGDGKFYPNERIQRKDMAVMIHNALKFADKDLTAKNIESILSMFVDSAEISDYARESTAICADAGIIMGRDTKEFDPDANATRAEASAIIERMLRYLEFIN